MPRGPKTAPGRGRTLFVRPPSGPPPGEGVRTNFRDLDPVWERERERVNRDALTRLKTPEGSADLQWYQDCHGSVRFGFGSVGSGSVRFRFVPVPVQFRFRFAFLIEKSILGSKKNSFVHKISILRYRKIDFGWLKPPRMIPRTKSNFDVFFPMFR